jgi:heme a synthase
VNALSPQNTVWLHRFAVATACATFCLIIAGGLVTSTDSGLAVPDWPLSYGMVMPPMIGGIFYEHGHRLVATFVGILTTVLSIWLWRQEDRKWVRNLGVIALLAVIAQGLLGGLTVLYLLPMPISVAHASLAQSFFCLAIIIALVTAPGWRGHRSTESSSIGSTRKLALVSTLAVFLQLVLGAIMRHSQAGLAIPDFPLSYGQLLPPMNADGLAAINDFRAHVDLPPVELGQVWIHFAHRIGALIVAIAVMTNVRQVLRNFKSDQRLREPALIQLMLLLTQLLLGALTVWTGKGVQVATAHVAAGALLLGASVFLSVQAFHLYRLPEKAQEFTFQPEASSS